MRKLPARDLKIKFLQILNELDEFSYEEGNPFLIRVGRKQYFIFLKNLSPAYFKNYPDVTRVQLPYSDRFSKILKADIPFIILGYDVDSDTVVSWNPESIKERLNLKSNVSLYSRNSLQKRVEDSEFKTAYLANGEKIVLFRLNKLIGFFDEIRNLFKSYERKEEITPLRDNAESTYSTTEGKLHQLTDKGLLQELRPYLIKNKVLQAVELTSKHYSGRYKNMSFKDWYKLVNDLYKKMNQS